MLLATVVLRLVTVASTVAFAWSVDELVEPHPFRVLTGVQGQGMFFWFRLLWGLVIPLALAAMSLHCARQRSNQSATGILYVDFFTVTVGEVLAKYLLVATTVPV